MMANRYPTLDQSVNIKPMKNTNLVNTQNLAPQKLSEQEKKSLENQKEVYCLIKIIDLVEKYFNMDRISQDEYQAQIKKLLQRYSNFTKQIKNYDLSSFVEQFKLQEYNWAISRVTTGISEIKNDRNDRILFVKIIDSFHEISDLLFMNQTKVLVKDIKNGLEELLLLITKLKPYLGNKNYNGEINIEDL